MLTVDPPRIRNTIRRLAALEPAAVWFGHGAPLRDPAALTGDAPMVSRTDVGDQPRDGCQILL